MLRDTHHHDNIRIQRKRGEIMSILGKRIKQLRTELKWSQRELAERVGYKNHSAITRIESGECDLPQSKIREFADVLGVSPSYLMGWDMPPKDVGALAAQMVLDPTGFEMMTKFSKLNASDKRTVLDMIDFLIGKQKKMP